MQEVKFCYQNIAISIDNSGFEVWNKNLFTSTGAFDCVALLHRDGKLYQQQELTNIDVAPEERSSFPLPFMVPALPGEYAVTISFRLKEDTSWAKKGHEVAFGQGCDRCGSFHSQQEGHAVYRYARYSQHRCPVVRISMFCSPI